MKRALFLILLVGCSRAREEPRDKSALVAASKDDVVATVDGRPIFAIDVVAQAKASGDDARHALAQLVDAEVLAGEAVARGLLSDEDVVYARRAAEARRLLALDFEPRTTLAQIPNADLRTAYERNRGYYDHGDIVEVLHIVALAPTKGPDKVPAAAHAQARAQIVALLPQAMAAASDDAFSALAVKDPPAGQVPEKIERLSFPREGVVEDSFAAAAFTLTRPGQTVGPVETSYGWHVIRLMTRTPAKHVSFEDALPELRQGTYAAWQKQELANFLQELIERWGAIVHPEKLEQTVAQ